MKRSIRVNDEGALGLGVCTPTAHTSAAETAARAAMAVSVPAHDMMLQCRPSQCRTSEDATFPLLTIQMARRETGAMRQRVLSQCSTSAPREPGLVA